MPESLTFQLWNAERRLEDLRADLEEADNFKDAELVRRLDGEVKTAEARVSSLRAAMLADGLTL